MKTNRKRLVIIISLILVVAVAVVALIVGLNSCDASKPTGNPSSSDVISGENSEYDADLTGSIVDGEMNEILNEIVIEENGSSSSDNSSDQASNNSSNASSSGTSSTSSNNSSNTTTSSTYADMSALEGYEPWQP